MPIDPEFNKRAQEFVAKQDERERQVQPERYDFDQSKYPSAPTSYEKKSLEKARDVPAPELNFDIGGQIEQDVWTNEAAEREERIEYIGDRLNERAEQFERDFDHARERDDDTPNI